MATFIFILICYGACNSIIFGSIFEWQRNLLAKLGTGGYSLYKLFTCFMCLGTWMGFIMSVIYSKLGYSNLTPMGSIGMDNSFMVIFLNGMVTAGGVWLIHTVQEALERAFVKPE